MKNTLINSVLLASSGVDAVYHASKEKFHQRFDQPRPYERQHRHEPRPHHEEQIQPVFFDAEFQMTFNPSWNTMDDLGGNSLQIVKELECKACRTFAFTMSHFLKYSKPLLADMGEWACDAFIHFFGYESQACPGIIEDQWTESILPLLQDGIFDQDTLCTFVFEYCHTDEWKKIDLDQWIQDLLKDKPAKALSNDIINKQYEAMTPKDKKDLIKVALISDLHMDWDYTPGMANECGRPVCCRSDSGLPTSPEQTAGKWGDLLCDPPQRTVQHLLDHISNDVKPAAVFWGGDSVPHNLDSLNMITNVNIMRNTTKLVADGLEGYDVFPTMGNHDTYPQDQIRVGGKGFEDAIKLWVPEWVQFVDGEENQKTWLDYGYFSKQLNNKTRVISLNSNICYTANFAGWTAFSDPGNQFKWLIEQLEELEEQDAYAIILAHVPNLDECTRQYARRYHAIADRFQHVIRFGMFSHVHSELYQVMKDINSGKSIGVNFIVGSVTTFQHKAPNFDILYLDPDTMLPVDMETYVFDLESANKNDTPQWNLYINVKDEYNMKDLSPASISNLSDSILADKDVCTKYKHNTKVGWGNATPVPCTADEQTAYHCQTGSSDSDEVFNCKFGDSFWRTFTLDEGHTVVPLINYVNHHWYEHK